MTNTKTEIPEHLLLAALDVQDSPLRRAGVNASMTQIQDGSKEALKGRVFVEIQDHLRSPKSACGFDLSTLDARTLAQKVSEKARSIPDFAEQDTLSVGDRCDFLRPLCSGRPSRALQQLTELAERNVDEELLVIRHQLHRSITSQPFAASELADRAAEAIELIATPTIDHTSVAQLSHAVRGLQQLRDNPAMLPPAQREAVTSAVGRRAEVLADETMDSLCLDLVTNTLRRGIKALNRQIQDCKQFAGEFQQNIADVRKVAVHFAHGQRLPSYWFRDVIASVHQAVAFFVGGGRFAFI